MGILTDKRILITGLLSNRSIAYGVAKSCRQHGAQLAFTYQNERFQDRVVDLAAEFDSRWSSPATWPTMRKSTPCSPTWAGNGMDWTAWCTRLHSRRAKRRRRLLEGLSRDGFRVAHEISS
jgi:enoyl-[acyl-carrier protein] reductase I